MRKAKPGVLNCGHAGVGSVGHAGMEAGVEIVPVAFKGANLMLVALWAASVPRKIKPSRSTSRGASALSI